MTVIICLLFKKGCAEKQTTNENVFVQTIEQLENELLHGQKLQGPATAAEVHQILKQKNMIEK